LLKTYNIGTKIQDTKNTFLNSILCTKYSTSRNCSLSRQ